MRHFQLIISIFLIYELDLTYSYGDTSLNSIYEGNFDMVNEILLDLTSIDTLLEERAEKFDLFTQDYFDNNKPVIEFIKNLVTEFVKVYNPKNLPQIPSKDFQLDFVQLNEKLVVLLVIGPRIIEQYLQKDLELEKINDDIIDKFNLLEETIPKKFQDQRSKVKNIKEKFLYDGKVSSDMINDAIKLPKFLQKMEDLQREIYERLQQLTEKNNLFIELEQDFSSIADKLNEDLDMAAILLTELDGFSEKTNAMAMKDVIKGIENLQAKNQKNEKIIPRKIELENLELFNDKGNRSRIEL